jgi:hypothetical protein
LKLEGVCITILFTAKNIDLELPCFFNPVNSVVLAISKFVDFARTQRPFCPGHNDEDQPTNHKEPGETIEQQIQCPEILVHEDRLSVAGNFSIQEDHMHAKANHAQGV